ncbi:GNAT family N-acetyltransferase [Actinoplanes sp. NPDC023936]|uniref:GNAT family N-acetyltransferase n=1 Tax=Actinoplanes sp. NPDC023936 TaxID=3154910 RepID=UPI00340F9F6B
MEDVSIRFLDGEPDAGILRRLYDTVIAPSFSPAEREPLERLRRVLAADELHGAIAVTPDGEPVGALFLEWFGDIRAALLCYFAVRPDLRGSGIGRRLVAVAGPHWRATLRPHVVFAEAEDPLRPGDDPLEPGDDPLEPGDDPLERGDDRAGNEDAAADYGDDDARLRLYAGFGGRRVPVPYLLPELSPGAGRLSGLLLLVIESDDVVSPTTDRIRSTIVTDFLVRYFARLEGHEVGEVHAGGKGDDGRLRQLLAECRRADFLPLVPLSEG